MLGGEARDRVAGFWRALGMTPPPEPDHLGALLGLMAALMEREAGEADPAPKALLGRARKALVWEHLLPWLPPYLERMGEMGSDYYAGWAALVRELLREEAPEPDTGSMELPAHLAEAPALPDPRKDGDGGPSEGEAFLRALLAPARSGILLTRTA